MAVYILLNCGHPSTQSIRIHLMSVSAGMIYDRLDKLPQLDWTFRTPKLSLGGREGPSHYSSLNTIEVYAVAKLIGSSEKGGIEISVE